MNRIILLLFTLFAFPAIAQVAENPLAHLQQQLQNYRHHQPEKLFVHTDRSFYASGDTVWFNAYLIDPQTNQLQKNSRTLFLDLISRDNHSILAQRLQTVNGTISSSFILPDSLKSGQYLLQGYTYNQLNASPEMFYRQPLWVNEVPAINQKTLGKSAEKVVQKLVFYPEGGNLRSGLKSKVVVKAVGTEGETVAAKGNIIDERGKTIAGFQTNESGLGSFLIAPEAGKAYKAQIQNGGQVQEFALEVSGKGYGLSLKNSKDSVTITLGVPTESSGPHYLILYKYGNALSADSVMFNSSGFRERTFSTKNFPEGMVQVSLLNAAFLPETERMFFHRKEPLQVDITSPKKTYGRREPVPVRFSLRDAAGKPIDGTFSVSVSSGSGHSTPGFHEKLLFPSAAAGFPYFSSDRSIDLENMLLTTSPGYFSWQQLTTTSNEKAAALDQENASNLNGNILENGQPVANAILYLMETNSGKTYLLTSNAEGRFGLPEKGTRFFYQVWQNGVQRVNAHLTVDLPVTPMPAIKDWQLQVALDSAETYRLQLRSRIADVYGAEIVKNGKKYINANIWPVYPADYYYPLEEYTQLNTMEEILREMISTVRVKSRKKKFWANVYDKDARAFFANQALYIIDGQPTWNNDIFLRLDASQLEQVNIYNSAKTLQPFGFMGNNGVIVVFTKSRNYQHPELRTENILTVTGQQTYSAFQMKDRPANIPDFRPTLYWNPALKTSNGQATFSFKTSDEMGNLRVRVEGITSDGRFISKELLIPVEPAR